MPMRTTCLVVVLAALLFGPGARAKEPSTEVHAFLRTHGTCTAAELSSLERGGVLAKSVTHSDDREIAVLGAMRVKVAKEKFLERFRDIAQFKRSTYVTQIAKFSDPPRAADHQTLTLDKSDLTALASCRPGDCELKLPANWIETFRREVDWSKPDFEARANRVMRRLVLDYVGAYLERGNDALAVYGSSNRSTSVADDLRRLVAATPYLDELAPELRAFLDRNPTAPLPRSEKFLYWSKESFGAKPVIGVFHVTIYRVRCGEAENLLIASRQIFASHYIDSMLALTAIVNEWNGHRDPDTYLIYLNRTRIDVLRGVFSGLRRRIVERRLLADMKSVLTGLRVRLES